MATKNTIDVSVGIAVGAYSRGSPECVGTLTRFRCRVMLLCMNRSLGVETPRDDGYTPRTQGSSPEAFLMHKLDERVVEHLLPGSFDQTYETG